MKLARLLLALVLLGGLPAHAMMNSFFPGPGTVHSAGGGSITVNANVLSTPSGSGTSASVTVTTTQANELIVVFSYVVGFGASSIADNIGLTWTHRGAANRFGSQFGDVYWAKAPSAGTYIITVTYGGTVGQFRLNGVSFVGANVTTPYDTNGSLPGLVGTGGGGGAEVVISTTNASTLIYAMYGYDSTNSPAVGSGWTVLQTATFFLTQYKVVSSAQTSLTLAQGSTVGDIDIGIGDAIKP